MLQRKRQQYKKSIRRRHIEKIFSDKRNHFLENNEHMHQVYANYEKDEKSMIESAIQNILTKLNDQNYQSTETDFNYLISQLQANNNQASFYLMKQYQNIGFLIKSLIKNEQINQGKMLWKRLDHQIQAFMSINMFKILSLINYGLIREQPYQHIISQFWLYFTSRSMQMDQESTEQLFGLSLKIIKKMLQGQHKIVLEQLQNRGLAKQIVSLITSKPYDLSDDNEKELIQILYNYLDLQNRLQKRDYSNNIYGITILGTQSSQKTHFLAFCLYILSKKLKDCEIHAVRSLILIFEHFEYLVTSMENDSISGICRLLFTSKDRKLTIKTIQLLNDIVYNGQQETNVHILQHGCILDSLQIQIRTQMNNRDQYSEQVINFISNILCNMTLININGKQKKDKNDQQEEICAQRKMIQQEKDKKRSQRKKLIEKMIAHPVWQLCYQNINMNAPYLSLIAVFHYLIDIIPRKKALRLFEQYVYAVSQLDFNLIPQKQMQAIKLTIIRFYSKASEFWDSAYTQKILQLCEINRLSFILHEVFQETYHGDLL